MPEKQLDDFDRGALVAIGLVVATHDQCKVAADVCRDMGLDDADCSDFCDYDKENLLKLKQQEDLDFKGL